MQLYFINWSFQNNEDQLFATNEFCQYLNEGKLNESIDGFELLLSLKPSKRFKSNTL